MPKQAFLTRESLEAAFRELGLKARAADKIVEIAVYDGSALVLTLPGRAATKDVDAVTRDRSDIEALARQIGIDAAAKALDVVAQYYPSSRISPKTQYGVEEIFARLNGTSDSES